MHTIKPCPWCGGDDVEIESVASCIGKHAPEILATVCVECGARGPEVEIYEFDDDDAVIDAWNNRKVGCKTAETTEQESLW